MTDIASLGIKVTSDGIPQAATSLDQLAKSGAKAEQQVAKVAPAMQQASKSAKELANATRNLPAQITDIVTGLASGQRPLQVLFQQGGQLKDMFGGVAPAMRAVAGELVGLINPITLTAAAVAGLAVAWKSASDEADAFNQALISTGAAASTTVQDLRAIAAELDRTTNATGGKASDVLTSVVGSGKFAADQLKIVAQAAIELEDSTGQSIEATIKQFVALQDEPVAAILKLNETQHFLTEGTLETIKALDDQGKSADASAVAVRAYADSISERHGEITSNLSLWAQYWRNVKSDAQEAFDAVVDGFRNSANAQAGLLTGLRNGLAFSGTALAPLAGLGSGSGKSAPAKPAADPYAFLNRPAPSASDLPVDSGVARARDEFERSGVRFASQRQRMELDIAEARKQGAAAGKSDLEIQQRIAAIQSSYAARAPKGPKAKKAVDEIGPIIARIGEQTAMLQAQAGAEDKLTAIQRLRVSIMQQLDQLGSKVSHSDRDRVETALREADAAEKAAIETDKAREAREREAEAKKKQAEAAGQVIDDLQFEIALIGKSRLEQAQMIALRQAGVEANSAYGESIAELVKHQQELAEQQALMDDVRLSAQDMFASFIDGSKSAGEAFEGFAKDLQRMAAQLLAEKAVQWVFGLFTGAGAGGALTAADNPFNTGGYSSGGYTGSGGVHQPAGVVHKGEVVWSQRDIARAGGVGVVEAMRMGRRGYADGGVVTPNMAPTTTAAVGRDAPGVTVVVENHGNGQTRTEESTGPDGGRMIKVIVDAAVSEVDRRIGTMGSTGRAIQSRFGVSPAGASRG
ncbi:phage tail length tape measure family protein [Lysobacter sp. HA35]